MPNENGWCPNDEFMRIDNIIIKVKDCSVSGCYRNEKEILRKDMTEEELARAYQVIRSRSFDLAVFRTKDC